MVQPPVAIACMTHLSKSFFMFKFQLQTHHFFNKTSSTKSSPRKMKLTVAMTVVLTTLLSGLIHGYDCKIVQFIFGDSLSDNGNNNRLTKSFAQAALPWYGIDYGSGMPNGRFTNGRTVSDIIGNIFSGNITW